MDTKFTRVLVVSAGAALTVAMCVLAACSVGETETSPTVAEVGERLLTLRDLDASLQGATPGQPTIEEKWRAVERWIDRELLYREAMKRSIHTRADVQRKIQIAARELVINAMLEDLFFRELTVLDTDIEQYYEEHRSLFRREETTVWARQIVVENLYEARRIHRQVRADPDEFEAIAREKSTDPSAAEGGDLGYLSESTAYSPEMWMGIQGLAEASISSIIRTTSGYHIFKIMDRRPAGDIMPLEEVRDDIVNRVRAAKRQALITQLVEELKLKEPYAIYQDQLMAPAY